MQCFEFEALRLLLYADTLEVFPDTPLDPLALGEVLGEFDVKHVRAYIDLEPDTRMALLGRVSESTFRLSAPASRIVRTRDSLNPSPTSLKAESPAANSFPDSSASTLREQLPGAQYLQGLK